MASQTILPKLDAPTQARIKLLHPNVRDEVAKLIIEANAKLPSNVQIRIVQGLRTIAEQNALYAQGRNGDKRPKVTNAKGGSSIHNYGLAIDFCLLIDNKEISWDTAKDRDKNGQADWLEVVTTFLRAGWAWGGNWRTFKDLPHLEKPFGHTWRTLLAKHNKKDFIAGTQYVKI
jgi:peptidoglycan LD-endopeptidase CwlK